MIEIIQIIPAVTDLYAVWEESNGTSYSVDRAYYLGWDVNAVKIGRASCRERV